MRSRSGLGWFQLIVGIVMIGVGIYALVSPDHTVTGFVVVGGIVAVIMGICDIVFYVRAQRFTGFGPTLALISGILSIIAGIILVVYPGTGKFLISVICPVWFIAHCISNLVWLNLIRIIAGSFYYFFSLIVNVIGLIMGILMIFQPQISLLSVSFIFGIYLIMLGVNSIVIAFSNTGSKGQW